MNWTEQNIARAIARQTLKNKCVVLLENCNWTGHECDVLGVTLNLRIIDIEVKISRADLKADAKKDKWWQRDMHPPKVWKHYYAMPADIWKPDLLECLPSAASGVLLMRWQADGVAVASVERHAKPAKDATRLKLEEVMDIARLANLRMWESYKKLESLERLP